MFVYHACIAMNSLLFWLWYLLQKWCNFMPFMSLAIEAQDFPRLYCWVLNKVIGGKGGWGRRHQAPLAALPAAKWFPTLLQHSHVLLHSQVGTDWTATAGGGQLQLFHVFHLYILSVSQVTIESSPPEGIWRWWRRGSSVTWGLERIGVTAPKDRIQIHFLGFDRFLYYCVAFIRCVCTNM